jgi:hypothetical protein
MNDDVLNRPPGPTGNPVVDVSITEEMESRVFLDKRERAEKTVTVVDGKVRKKAGTFRGEHVEWHTQRDATNPSGEAREGVDEPTMWYGDDDGDDDNYVPVADISDRINSDIADGCDDNGADLNKVGLHMLQAHAHLVNGDHEAAHDCLHKGLNCFHRLHKSLKEALG